MYSLERPCHSVCLELLASSFLLTPQGMAKAVADVNDPDEKQGGFASGDSDITGFSHMHDSGTGGVCVFCSNLRDILSSSSSRLRLGISPSSLKVAVQMIFLITVSLPKPIEHREESTTPLKLTRGTSQSV